MRSGVLGVAATLEREFTNVALRAGEFSFSRSARSSAEGAETPTADDTLIGE
jgi:hypothetical protein